MSANSETESVMGTAPSSHAQARRTAIERCGANAIADTAAQNAALTANMA